MRHALHSLILVALLAVQPAQAQVWSGAGTDNNWSTGANWVGGVAPASSNATSVTFPAGAARRTPFVDAPWTINLMVLTDPGYVLGGQAITFAGVAPALLGNTTSLNTLTNPITLAASTTVGGNGYLRLSGGIGGNGPLFIVGTGFVELIGASTFTGGTTIGSAAILLLVGSMPGQVLVDNGGQLRGPGTVNGALTVAAGGLLLPGGVFDAGDITLAGRLGIVIGGAHIAAYDRVNAHGNVLLNNSTLLVEGTYNPAPGDVFTIIANDGTDAVTGTFQGLPEGAQLTFNGVRLRISYVGGTGNDVTLTAAALAADRQVPTLSQWALVLLAALMLGVASIRARRP